MSIKIIEAFKTEDGRLFTDWSEACKWDRRLNRKQFVSNLRELERVQAQDKRKMGDCCFRNEPAIWKQAQVQRRVARRSVELREMLKDLAEIS